MTYNIKTERNNTKDMEEKIRNASTKIYKTYTIIYRLALKTKNIGKKR